MGWMYLSSHSVGDESNAPLPTLVGIPLGPAFKGATFSTGDSCRTLNPPRSRPYWISSSPDWPERAMYCGGQYFTSLVASRTEQYFRFRQIKARRSRVRRSEVRQIGKLGLFSSPFGA